MKNDMPESIWALDAHLTINECVHIGQFINQNENGEGKTTEYIRKDKYERMEKRFTAAMQTIKNIDDMSEYSSYDRKEFERECEALTVKLNRINGK
mgnify:CR=1 FL=1